MTASRMSGPRRTLGSSGGCATNAVHHRILLPLTGPSGSQVSASLLAAAGTKDLATGAPLIRPGISDGRTWLVLSGVLFAETTTPEGNRSIVEFLGPGDLIGEESHGDALEPSAQGLEPTVRSLTPCRLRWWPAGAVTEAARHDPLVGMWVQHRLSARLHRARGALARSLGFPVIDRVEQVLRDLAVLHGRPVPGGLRLQIPLSQETLAAAVGATRESVNRAVRALQAGGRLQRSGRLYTLLTASGQTDPSPVRPGKPFPPDSA